VRIRFAAWTVRDLLRERYRQRRITVGNLSHCASERKVREHERERVAHV
jgi:hypothetical protein